MIYPSHLDLERWSIHNSLREREHHEHASSLSLRFYLLSGFSVLYAR